ncbi:MAG: BMP family ABC transporter substrate-binding protein [Clostridia bacterium]|nr:BMP family ABC transporter substrate-binding protein [Clostridia bacterium]
MKKFVSFALSAVMALGVGASLVSCGDEKDPVVALIALHDDNSTYDKNFIDAFKEACANKGLTKKNYTIVTGIPESEECYNAAVDLAEEGYKGIFADSFGHEAHMINAAKEYPNVQFCHATGTQAHTAGLDNFHNAFAAIYEGRYLAGVAAGLKLNEMIADGDITADQAKMGYVGAFTFAEVISGYTSFYLGAKSVCPTVTMEVQFTGSWYDEAAEKTAAENLINNKGCKLISQHADSMGAPTACETAGVPNVSYNGSTEHACPNTFIISSRINWVPYFEMMIDGVQKGTNIPTDYTGTIASNSVVLTGLGAKAPAEGTQAVLDAVKAQLVAGELKVFNLSTFTVGGNVVADDHKADVDTDAAYTPDTVVIKSAQDVKYFAESEFRSGPYFDLRIDGITLINEMY